MPANPQTRAGLPRQYSAPPPPPSDASQTHAVPWAGTHGPLPLKAVHGPVGPQRRAHRPPSPNAVPS